MGNNKHEDITNEIEALIDSVKSIQIATLNKENKPEISYTPFLRYNPLSQNQFYIFISELASHTQNLQHCENLSLLFIQSEQACKNIFARKRLILECGSQKIDRDEKSWDEILQKFETEQGKTVGLLKTLPDFHLFEINAKKGSYIKGFGKAFALSGKNLSTINLQTT